MEPTPHNVSQIIIEEMLKWKAVGATELIWPPFRRTDLSGCRNQCAMLARRTHFES